MSTPIISRPSSLKMARSPIFYTGKNNALANDSLDSMSIDLKIWSGATAPSSNNYELSKAYSVDEVINFEVSNLIRGEFLHDFDIYNGTGYDLSPEGEVLWVNATGSWTYSNNGAAPVSAPHSTSTTYKFLAVDGWSNKLNPHNTEYTSVQMAVARKRYVLASNYEMLAIYNTDDFASITISWNNGDNDTFYETDGTTSAPPLATSSDSKYRVIYAGVGPANLEANAGLDNLIKPSTHSDGDWYDVILKDSLGATLATIRYELTCEPKYTPYQVAFVNRYGVADFITFFKSSTEQGNFTGEQYNRSIYQDGFTSASLQTAKYQDFNINSRNSITMNTGWVEEAYADVIEDILMSEQVAVLLDGTWVAASPNRGSIDYQKEVNEKLINYTLSFEIAFNERSLIR